MTTETQTCRPYFDYRERMARDIRSGVVMPMTRERLVVHGWGWELPEEEARKWADRFLAEVAAGPKKLNPAS
jgi:hypothetical protein